MSKPLKHSKNTLDTSVPKPETNHLSESDKKKLELGDRMEHEQGGKRESLQKEIRDLDTNS